MSLEVKDGTQVSESTENPSAEGAESAGQTTSPAEDTGSSQEENSPQSGENPPGPGAPNGSDTAAEAVFKAREKFKVMDKEYDVPAWMKGSIKDAETEKQAIELLEKSFGLEHVKTKQVETRKERDHYKGEATRLAAAISDAREVYQKGDIDLFLDKLSIPHERMLQWALDKVKYSELPEDQKRIFDERKEAQRKAWSAEKQLGEQELQIQEQVRSTRQTLLDTALARADVSSFANDFDTRVGRPGAFADEVIARGQLAWIQSKGKVDLTPEQAIEQVMSFAGGTARTATKPAPGTSPAPAATSQQAPAGGSTTPAPAKKPVVIPNVQGGTQSPMKASPSSIEDLKKIRDAKLRNG
jgi:hypothetical protein